MRPGGTLLAVSDRNRPPAAVAPALGKVPPQAGRKSNEPSALEEGHDGVASPPDLAPPRRPMPSEDFATKSYDLEELNRLRAMSNASASAPRRLDLGDDAEPEEDEDDSTTSRLDIALHARPSPVEGASGEAELADDPEEQTTNRFSVRRGGADKAGLRRTTPTRPEGKTGGPAAGPSGSSAQDPRSPDVEVNNPEDIDDEDSNDEGPTIRRGKKSDVNNERAALARPVGARVEPPADLDDDPFDDGPTRMRPPEALAPPAEPILKPLRPPPADLAAGAPERDRPMDTLTGPTERMPDARSARASSKPRVAAPFSGQAPLAPSSWDPEAQAPTRSLSGLGATQPLASSALLKGATLPMPTLPVGGPPVGGPPVGGPPVGGLPVGGPPVGGPPVGGPPMVAPPLGAPLPIAPPSPSSSSAGRQRLIAALVGVALGLAVLFVYGAFAEPELIAPASPADSASAAGSALPSPSAAAASASAATSAEAPATTASAADVGEREAREALSKLREGIGACVERGASALPATAPAVPPLLKQSRPDGYTAKAEEWKALIWSCARFSAAEPMRFQLQWQADKPFQEGMAIAWIDGDDDGNADRALSFRVTMKAKGKVELGDIGPIDASSKVVAKPQ